MLFCLWTAPHGLGSLNKESQRWMWVLTPLHWHRKDGFRVPLRVWAGGAAPCPQSAWTLSGCFASGNFLLTGRKTRSRDLLGLCNRKGDPAVKIQKKRLVRKASSVLCPSMGRQIVKKEKMEVTFVLSYHWFKYSNWSMIWKLYME